MADTALQVVVDNVIVDVPIVDSSVVEQGNLEVVKIEKLEPGVIEIQVATTQLSSSHSEMILPDSGIPPQAVSSELPQTFTLVETAPAVDAAVSSPLPSKENVEFQPSVVSTPRMSKTDILPAIRQRNKLLTSSILSTEEITQVIIERSEKKRPHQLPEGGDLIFQKQLTKRLAEKVVKEETLNQNITVEMFTPPPPPKLPKLDGDQPDLDAQMLLQILEEGAESQYPEPSKLPKIPKLIKSDKDKELEKELALKQLMEVSGKRRSRESNNNDSGSKPKKRLKNEVQRLLQDEGAINMLYAIEKGEEAKATALPSKRRMKKALMKKAQEVSQAIMDGSALNKGLRLRHPLESKIKKEPEEPDEKNQSVDQTLDKSCVESKPDFAAPSPTLGASKIVRRHSSSSSYSGNNSPIRRISLDEVVKSDGEKDKKLIENGVSHSPKPKVALNISPTLKNIKKSLNTSLQAKLSITKDKGKTIRILKKKKIITPEKLKRTLIPATDKKTQVDKTIDKKTQVDKTTDKKTQVDKTTDKKTQVDKTTDKKTQIDKTTDKKTQDDLTTDKKTQVDKEIVADGKDGIIVKEESCVEIVNKGKDQPVDENGFKEKLQMEFTNKLKTMMVRQGLLGKNKKRLETGPATTSKVTLPPPAPNKQILTENKTLTCETIWQMLQDDWDMGEDPDDPPSPSPYEASSFDHSPPHSSPRPAPLKNEIAPLPPSEPEVDVIPENKNEVPFSHQLGSCTYMFKELMLRRIGPLTHVNIAPVSTLLPQAFNVQVLKELCSVIESCGSDPRCKCLLLTSSGSLFSSGVDLPCLLAVDAQSRSQAAKATALAVKEFAHKLGMFSKMVVAGVSGPCVGLGVGMLPLCDVVLSAPRSVYLTPYSTLGYIPEAAASLTLPAIIGHRMAASMLIGGRKLTAQEAVSCGLVTQVLPEENFASQVLETAFNMAVQSAQSMESTKALMMHTVRSRLTTVLATEAILLQQHWVTHDCQLRIKEKAEKLLNE